MTAKYGVYITKPYGYDGASRMVEYETLVKAKEHVGYWRRKAKPTHAAAYITLVRILSEHKEGDWV